jgi:hypothetical protein
MESSFPSIVIDASSRCIGSIWLQRIIPTSRMERSSGASFPMVELSGNLFSNFLKNQSIQAEEKEWK